VGDSRHRATSISRTSCACPRRQERLGADDGPQLWVVLGEAVLHRPVGGAAVLQAQLRRLRELSELRPVSLQVVPYDIGAHAALGTSFTLFRLAEPEAVFVYVEWLTDAVYLDAAHDTEVYGSVFNRMLVAAANERQTRQLLDERIRALNGAQ
jgi:hypothetical protein